MAGDLKEGVDSIYPTPPATSMASDAYKGNCNNNGNGNGVFKRSRSNMAISDLGRQLITSSGHERPADLSVFVNHIKNGATPHAIIIDASSSAEVASLHPVWLRDSVHIVTANKRAIASSLELYNEVYSAVMKSNKMYMSEVYSKPLTVMILI